jgi:mono/diheme cytochrome c family protein
MLTVRQTLSNGGSRALPNDAVVIWTEPNTVHALPPGSTAANPLPAPGEVPTAVFVDNTSRAETTAAGALFVLDAGSKPDGTIKVSATIADGSTRGNAYAMIVVHATPQGDSSRGAAPYAVDCASCHGASGGGSPGIMGTSGTLTYTMSGRPYDYPAPGLNAAAGNPGSDPAWTTALFAIAARGDFDNGGVTLRAPMPPWLILDDRSSHAPLTTEQLADIFAWLKTELR